MLRVELVAAEGRHDQQPLVTDHPDQKPQQIQRRAIRPVDVLDDQHHRLLLRQPVEKPQRRLEQPGLRELADRLGGPRRRCTWQQSCQVGGWGTEESIDFVWVKAAGQLTQRIGDRAVGQAATAQLEAATEQHLGPIVDLDGELLHQPGLADAGLAGDQPGSWLAGHHRLQRLVQPSELILPADEAGTGHPARHGLKYHVR
jgi:hypothetical protein